MDINKKKHSNPYHHSNLPYKWFYNSINAKTRKVLSILNYCIIVLGIALAILVATIGDNNNVTKPLTITSIVLCVIGAIALFLLKAKTTDIYEIVDRTNK